MWLSFRKRAPPRSLANPRHAASQTNAPRAKKTNNKKTSALHAEDAEAQRESGLTRADQRLLTGVLDYKHRRVADVMTPLGDAFMLPQSAKLNFATLSRIFMSGCSRIPVYDDAAAAAATTTSDGVGHHHHHHHYGGGRQRIVSILFVKDLILVDPGEFVGGVCLRCLVLCCVP